ncbi:MAG TPA: hypothetical protein VF432_12675 [Thermoanaerobaculia bacterium]
MRKEEWSLATRVAFRFCFAFFLLYNLPFPLEYIPKLNLGAIATEGWSWLIGLVAQPWFGVQADRTFNGSGDKTWNWIQIFLQTSIAAAATLVWSIADRRARSYPRLHHWLRVYVRFALAAAMIVYGTMKVIPSQFPAPATDRLLQPFGEASPMGLLWTFMGASAAYTIFTGLGELISGLLLTTRRTTLAGALLAAGVMTHVVVLNFCYDVPVKLYSSVLLIQALFLLAPDARRLAATVFAGPSRAAWWKVALRTAAVLGFTAYLLQSAAAGRKNFGDLSARSPLRGIWNVTHMTVDGVEQAPLLSNGTRWRRLVFDNQRYVAVQQVDDKLDRYAIALGPKAFSLTRRVDPSFHAAFDYKRPDPRTLVLDGKMNGKKIHATMKLEAEKEFLLRTRGFHWINEAPFNR